MFSPHLWDTPVSDTPLGAQLWYLPISPTKLLAPAGEAVPLSVPRTGAGAGQPQASAGCTAQGGGWDGSELPRERAGGERGPEQAALPRRASMEPEGTANLEKPSPRAQGQTLGGGLSSVPPHPMGLLPGRPGLTAGSTMPLTSRVPGMSRNLSVPLFLICKMGM